MFRLRIVVFMFLMVCVGSSQSFAREQATVKATENDKYVRLFFYCKQPVKFTTDLSGNKLKIAFGHDINIDTSQITAASQTAIQAVNFSNNTATITLADDSYNVRKFLGEDFIGVDILKPAGVKPPKIKEAKIVAPVEIPAPQPALEVASKPVETPAVAPVDVFVESEPKPALDDMSEAEKIVASIPQVNAINPEGEYIAISKKVSRAGASQNEPSPNGRGRGEGSIQESLRDAPHPNPLPRGEGTRLIPVPKLRQQLAKVEPKANPRFVDVTALAAIAPAAGEAKPAPVAETKVEAVVPAAAPVAAPAKLVTVPVTEAKKEEKPVVVAAPAPEPIKPAQFTPIAASALDPVAVKPAEIIAPVAVAQVLLPSAAAAKSDSVPVNPNPPVAIKSGEPEAQKAVALPAISLPKAAELVSDDEAEQQASDTSKIVESPADKFKGSILSKMVFDWNEQVAASVFKRAGYLWVVFDKNKDVNVKSLVAANSTYLQKGTQMPNRFYTILRLKLKTDINTVSYKEGNNWVIGFVQEKTAPAQLAKMDMKFSDLNGSKVLLDSDDPLKPLRLIDAEVGDEIVILPFAADSMGMKEPHKHVDFTFLETSQGAVIQVISDAVDVAVLDTGVAVAGPSNRIANASQAALKELRDKAEEARLKAERLKSQSTELTLLKFTTWKLGGDTSYEKDLQELTWKITEVDWSEKNQYRLALARFYFAHGLYPESLGTISLIKEYDEKFGKTNDVKSIEATALYMLGRYKEAADVYDAMNMEELTAPHRAEAQFWRVAAEIQISNQIKTDKFLTKNPLDKKDEDEGSADKVENTKLMRDTSTRLLKIIRKMDPDFVNADELQKLEATARFVTDHYQEAISRFEETDLLTSGDVFQAEDNKLWWSASANKRTDATALPLIQNIDNFLKDYPEYVFNDFALIAVEDVLKRNDLAKSEEIIASFKEETRLQQKNSIEFFRGLYYAKNEEDDKAVEAWKALTEDALDPYNRARAQFASTIFQLDKKKIDTKQAIANLNTIRSVWRGGQVEFHALNLLGEFYMENHQPLDALRVWRETISAFPGSDESLLIAKKMSDTFIRIFAQGEADKMPKIDAIALYYEFRELTPIGKPGDEMIGKLVDRLIDVDLLDRAAALLTHQVRFRLVGEDRDSASTKLVKVHLMNHDSQKAIDVLDATENSGMNEVATVERRYLRSQALLELGKNNKVLSLLNEDNSKTAYFLRADVYWRNGVWRKVIDELEVPFREMRRDNKNLGLEETNQLIRLAVAYALVDRQKRLQILYEDFAELIDDPAKKNLLTFIAANKGPVDFKNIEQTVEYKDMETFLNNYMKLQKEISTSPVPAPDAGATPPAPSAQATPAAPAKAG